MLKQAIKIKLLINQKLRDAPVGKQEHLVEVGTLCLQKLV